MGVHLWWTEFGQEVEAIDELVPASGRDLAKLAANANWPGVALIGLRQSDEARYAGVHLDVDVERPQDLDHPIKATEPIAILFPFEERQPTVLALRDDFPDTPHQNWTPPEMPCALCVDDRPWAEIKLSATASDLVRRVQSWLAKAARGELHDAAQPPDPLFFISPISFVLPAAAINQTDPVELIGYMRPDNDKVVLSRLAQGANEFGAPFTVLALRAAPQAMARLRHAPTDLAGLSAELAACGIDLTGELKARLKRWAGLQGSDIRRLAGRLAIVVIFPVANGERESANDVRAFMTHRTAGEIGAALGVLYPNASQVGAQQAYLQAIPEHPPTSERLRIDPAQVHVALNRDLAAAVAGNSARDARRTVLVGAGALGSQLAVNLVREGRFSWIIIDDDYLFPHNFTRHALFASELGAPKAEALARTVSALLDEKAEPISCDILDPDADSLERVNAAMGEADIIIDASASVAVSRHLSDLPEASARRLCTFFNPAGTAVVVLAEDQERTITLRDLEAQYHRLVQEESLLQGHLESATAGLRYSGSCRALTNRISASSAALLSALASRGIVDCLQMEEASISVWVLSPTGEVRLVRRPGEAVAQMRLGGWTVNYDAGLLDRLAALRQARLPDETGGVLLGIADMSRRSLHVVHAMTAPHDSRGSRTGFERGVTGLLDDVSRATAASMHQLRYVGEWHSHPDGSSVMPSRIDLAQLLWLGGELCSEELPGLMAIAAEDGRFTFALSQVTGRSEGDGDVNAS